MKRCFRKLKQRTNLLKRRSNFLKRRKENQIKYSVKQNKDPIN